MEQLIYARNNGPLLSHAMVFSHFVIFHHVPSMTFIRCIPEPSQNHDVNCSDVLDVPMCIFQFCSLPKNGGLNACISQLQLSRQYNPVNLRLDSFHRCLIDS